MPDFELRKTIVTVEEIRHDLGPAPAEPRLRAACLAVVANPFAGRFHENLQPAMEDLKPLGLEMSRRLIAALGGPGGIDGYGKGTIVGEAGELEHGALWHVPGGYAMRELLGESVAAHDASALRSHDGEIPPVGIFDALLDHGSRFSRRTCTAQPDSDSARGR